MSLNDRSKSILLQVAYKGVIEQGTGDKSQKDAVLEQFNLLVDLHDELGLSPDDGKPAPRGNGATRRAANVDKAADDAPITNIGGVDYLDYRGAKAIGAKVPGFPDFKLASKPNAKGSSKWLLFEGEPTEFAVENGLA